MEVDGMKKSTREIIKTAPFGSRELLDAIESVRWDSLPEVDEILDTRIDCNFSCLLSNLAIDSIEEEQYWKKLAGDPNPLHANFPTDKLSRSLNLGCMPKPDGEDSPPNKPGVGNPRTNILDRHRLHHKEYVT
jgi:hypothetical protein